jgi:ESCRT-I complex subunit VPS28
MLHGVRNSPKQPRLTTHHTVSQGFITVMDALKLKLRAKDQLHPLLSELMTGYTRFKASSEWEGRPKILHW